MYLKEIFTIFCILEISLSVDPNNFKTCEKSSFCRRCRKVQPGNSSYNLVPGTLQIYSDSITNEIINKDNNQLFIFKLEALEGNTFRFQIDEKVPLKPRYKVTDALKGNPRVKPLKIHENGTDLEVISGPNKVIIHATPFSIDFYQNEVLTVSVNQKGLMRFEHLRTKPQPDPLPAPNADELENQNQNEGDETVVNNEQGNVKPPVSSNHKSIEDTDPGSWEENFKSHQDSKPRGPEAVALDFSFPQAEVLFGIPEHADSFILETTTEGDPYRLYNLDVFEYELNSRMALYGSVPVLYGHGSERTAGVFWQNAAETWIDIHNSNVENNMVSSLINLVTGPRKSGSPLGHFMSESGIIDVFIMLGPTPLEAFKQYTDLTGTTNLPQLFALAYHQSRWNYVDQQDVEGVSKKFDEHDIPMDTMWLDIEYTDGKKYFTWDPIKFSNPLNMIKNLTDLGRHLTIIIDPHIKRDGNYFFHKECTENNYYTKTKDGHDYEGWCWPGEASYPDLFDPKVREYFASQYLLENFKTSTADVMIWNDMNEPSVFNGPEITMLKDNIHHGGWEHRAVHNLYGHMQLNSTFTGLTKRDPTQRPFILSRSHFAGSQRFAAIWTGDNMADWGHLATSIKMCLSEAVAGFSFCGADIGGFFQNPDGELFYRWYQAGAFQPFYRAHSHMETKRREPWLYPNDVKLIIRDAIRKRYSYLPFWYTMFYEHERDGLPVMRPLLAHYPKDKNAFKIDYEYLLQDRLLVRPVLEQGATSVNVYFPVKDEKNGDWWYDVDTFERFEKPGIVSVPVDNYKIPVFQRGGTIIPKKERVRRASTLMINDPYTLIVCLDDSGSARGTLFIDDEKSYEYRKGRYEYIEYEFKENTLKNKFLDKNAKYVTKSWLERVVIAGLENVPKSAKLKTDSETQELEILTREKAIVIRKPGVNMSKSFTISLQY